LVSAVVRELPLFTCRLIAGFELSTEASSRSKVKMRRTRLEMISKESWLDELRNENN